MHDTRQSSSRNRRRHRCQTQTWLLQLSKNEDFERFESFETINKMLSSAKYMSSFVHLLRLAVCDHTSRHLSLERCELKASAQKPIYRL